MAVEFDTFVRFLRFVLIFSNGSEKKNKQTNEHTSMAFPISDKVFSRIQMDRNVWLKYKRTSNWFKWFRFI